MKKFFKTIAKLYAAYLIISAISAAVLYIYGCMKYGTRMMSWSIRFSLSAYKAVISNKLSSVIYKLQHLKENRKLRKSPYYVLLEDAKDWDEDFI